MEIKNVFFIFCFFVVFNFIILRKNEKDFFFYSKNEIIEKSKYIMYECYKLSCNGFGDRLKGIMSTFALSLLTNRKLIIRMHHICKFEEILIPNKINWNFEQIRYKKLSSIIIDLNKRNSFSKFVDSKDILEEYSNIDLIIVHSNYDIVTGLSKNKNLQMKLQSLGYSQQNFKIAFQFKKWFDHLFKLTKKYKRIFDQKRKLMKPKKNSKLICIQIRIGDKKMPIKIEKKIAQKFWDFINWSFLKEKKTKQNFSLYITADREYLKNDGKNILNLDKIFFMKNTSIHFAKHNINCSLVQNVIFEFYMLKICDIGIVSHSGFGILALWNRENPFENLYVFTPKNQTQLQIDYWNRQNLKFKKFSKLEDVYFL